MDWDRRVHELRKSGRDLDRVGARNMRNQGGEVKGEVGRVVCSWVGCDGVGKCSGETLRVESGVSQLIVLGRARRNWERGHGAGAGLAKESTELSLLEDALVPRLELGVDWEDTGHGSPLCCHVGNGQALVDAQVIDTGSDEFNGGVENLVVVEVASKGDDDVLACHSWRELALELDLDDPWNLPPELAGRPDTAVRLVFVLRWEL